jgi:DNA-binding transcriptional ArsR family regulator
MLPGAAAYSDDMTVRRDGAGGGDLDIASIGMLFADIGRCRMMLALSDGSELSAARLAAEANVTAATASSHLKKLTDAGLLHVTQRGRNRNYRIAGPQVGELIEALEQIAPVVATRSLRQSTQTRQWRQARTCYDHIAGHLGVALLDGLLAHGYLTPADPMLRARGGERPRYRVTEAGSAALAALGIPARAGQLVEGHNDSTELRPHLAGRFARQLAERLAESGWIRKTGYRAVHVTDLGAKQLAACFGLGLDD